MLRATPLLGQAHNLIYQVREGCHDDVMARELAQALAHVRAAQERLRAIEREARRADAA